MLADLGRAFGIFGFTGLSAITWLLAGPVIDADRIDPVRGASGALGWGLFVLGWGAVRRTDAVPEDDPRALPGEELRARAALPRGSIAVMVVAVVGAMVPAFWAWRVVRSEHALLAQGAAVACALAILSAGAHIALHRGRWRPVEPPARRLNAALLPLTVLGIMLVIGLVQLLAG